MAQSPYPIRLPGNLRSLLEIEAAKHGQSLASYIVGACWAQLERHSTPWSIDAVVAAGKGDLVAVPIFPQANPGDEGYGLTSFTAEVPICGKDWWEDGEHWECLMDTGHKESKHGLRGMVRKLGD